MEHAERPSMEVAGRKLAGNPTPIAVEEAMMALTAFLAEVQVIHGYLHGRGIESCHGLDELSKVAEKMILLLAMSWAAVARGEVSIATLRAAGANMVICAERLKFLTKEARSGIAKHDSERSTTVIMGMN